MSIKAKLIILAGLALVTATATGFLIFQNSDIVKSEVAKQAIINQIQNKMFERAALRDEYLLYHGERPIVQIQATSNAIEKFLVQASNVITSADEKVLVDRLGDNNKSLDQTLAQIVASFKSQDSSPSTNAEGLEQRLISQLIIYSQDNAAIATSLADASRNKVIEVQQKASLIVSISITVIVLVTIAALYFIWSSIGKPLQRLKEAAVRIAALDFSTTTSSSSSSSSSSRDEIGGLSRAFDSMVGKLKESYATLDQRVNERTQDLENAKIAARNVLEDLTNEKSSSEALAKDLEKFKLGVDNVSEIIVITDPEGIVIYANRAVAKITGYKPEEALGKKIGALWQTPMPTDYYQKLWDTIKKQKKVFIGEIQNKRKNGEIYTAAISISPILNKDGDIEFFVGIERDITREKEVDKAKSEFVSLASHQLRTPLGIIKWYLEALQNEAYFNKAPAPVRNYFDEIYKSNERVLSLVRDLLSVSRIEQGQVKSVPKPVNLIEAIREIVDQMQIMARKKGVTPRLTVQEHKIPVINIDPLMFHEVIENLIANSIEYTKAGGSVDVSIDKVDKRLLISVKDTGIGISAADQKKLFSKFFRSEKAARHNPEGSGLGLYVVKSYTEGWGGKVSVQSQEGKGSTFTIALPLKPKNRWQEGQK